MLSKATNGEISVDYNKQVGYQEKSGSSTFYNTITVPYNGSFTITARYVNTNSYTNTRCSVSGGGTQLGDYDAYAEKDKTVTLTYTGTGTASIRYYNNAGSVPGATYLTLVCNIIKVYRNVDKTVKLLPREVKEIGFKASTTLFGNHTDGVFYDALPNDLKLKNDYYDATGSDITNFKGYIRIKINNHYYDIPLKNRSDV